VAAAAASRTRDMTVFVPKRPKVSRLTAPVKPEKPNPDGCGPYALASETLAPVSERRDLVERFKRIEAVSPQIARFAHRSDRDERHAVNYNRVKAAGITAPSHSPRAHAAIRGPRVAAMPWSPIGRQLPPASW
jgi:hypothetical protein